MRGPRTAMKSGPRLPQLEKSPLTETKTQHSQKKRKGVEVYVCVCVCVCVLFSSRTFCESIVAKTLLFSVCQHTLIYLCFFTDSFAKNFKLTFQSKQRHGEWALGWGWGWGSELQERHFVISSCNSRHHPNFHKYNTDIQYWFNCLEYRAFLN